MEKISVNKFLWKKNLLCEKEIAFVKSKYYLSDISSRIVMARTHIGGVESYLKPKLKTQLPDPFSLKDLEKSAERIFHAIDSNEKIVIFGDYDVDGATSSALLSRYFKMIGYNNFYVYIPDRIKEGYGPSIEAFRNFANDGVNIIITVDCGTLSFEPIKEANKLGIDVIVIDHHLSDVNFPECYGLINPNRIDETFPHRNLAAVGVAYFVIIGLNVILRRNGYFTNIKEPDLLSLLDIVALGTVCDVMTITGINRVFVSQGLKILSMKQNKGIAALCDVAGISDNIITTYHLGYILGPRINAGGRVGESSLGVKLLSSDNYDEAYSYALQLNRFNEERKSIEYIVLEEAMKQVESADQANMPIIFAQGEGWHPGVIGIVCGRIKEKTQKPSAVISIEQNIGKASARSVPGIDLGANIVLAKNEGLLIAGGGHAMAAGFTVMKDKIDALYNYLANQILSSLKSDIVPTRYYDADISIYSVNSDLVTQIKLGEPYGNGNHEPIFRLCNVRIVKSDILKGGSIRVLLADSKTSSNIMKAVAFKVVDTELGHHLLLHRGEIDIIGKIAVSYWNQRESIEFYIEDMIL